MLYLILTTILGYTLVVPILYMRTVGWGDGGENGSNLPNESGKGGIFPLWPERVVDARYLYLTGIHILLFVSWTSC